MVKLLNHIREAAESSEDLLEANELFKIGAFVCMCTSGSLRGYEGFYADLASIKNNIHKGKNGVAPKKFSKTTVLDEQDCEKLPHVCIALLGKFKGGHTIDPHYINVASVSRSGLEPRWWIEKALEVATIEGRTSGPLFATPDGDLASSADYDAVFRKYLKKVQRETNLIDENHNIDTMYGISRTPRKTATTRTKRAGFNDLVDEMNRWRKTEAAKGRAVKFGKMNMLYSEAVLMMPVTWCVSYAL